MSNERAGANGAGADVYAPQADMAGSMQNGYAPPVMNGAGIKRGRDDEDDRPGSGGQGLGGMDLKRRKMLEGSVPSPPLYDARQAPALAGQRRR